VAVTGTTTPKTGGTPVQQDNKALFVLHQGSDGVWRFARYAINCNKPIATAQRP
jgi:ketosteroid isomerase-like protein